MEPIVAFLTSGCPKSLSIQPHIPKRERKEKERRERFHSMSQKLCNSATTIL
jgi:hypothetical protein